MADFNSYDSNLTPYENYYRAVSNLTDAFRYLMEAWDECDSEDYRWEKANHPELAQELDFRFDSYPFSQSFEELLLDVYNWDSDVTDWYNGLPDHLKGSQEYN